MKYILDLLEDLLREKVMLLRLLLAITVLSSSAFAQNTGELLPVPVQPFNGTLGTVIAAGRVCTTLTGTTTSSAVYSDPALSTALPNPIVLDSLGRPTTNGSTLTSVYLGARSYRIALYANGTGNTCNGTAVGTQIYSRDNIYNLAQLQTIEFSTQLLDKVCHAAPQSGANAGIKIAACHTALPATGGTIDARGLEGSQTITSTITFTKPTRLLLGAGTYTYSGATVGIILGTGSSIAGISPGESIFYVSNTGVDGIQPGNFTSVSNMTVRGPGNVTPSVGWIGIEFEANDVNIFGNIIEEWGSHCINTGGGSYNVNIENNIIRECYQDGFLSPGGATNVSVKNNWIHTVGSWGIDCTCSRSIISGNHIYNNGATFPSDGGGISMLAYMHANGTLYTIKKTVVANNTLRNNTLRGISMVASGGGQANDNIFSSNTIEGDAAQTNALGFLVVVGGSTSELNDNLFIGNIATNHTGGSEGAGFFGQYLTNGSFDQNKLIGNRFDGNDYGIVAQAGITDLALEFNDVIGNTTLGISDSGTRTRNVGNRNTVANNYTQFVTPLQLDTMHALTASSVTLNSTGNTQFSLASSAGGTREYASLIDTAGNHYPSFDAAAGTARITVSSAGVTAINSALSVGTSVSIGVNPSATGTLRMPNNSFLYLKSSGGTDIPMVGMDGSNNTLLRSGGTAVAIQSSTGTNVVSITDAGTITTTGPIVAGNTVKVTVLGTATATPVCYDGAAGNLLTTCVSLRSVKDNIEGLTVAEGNSVLDLQPSSFTVKSTGQPMLGFIAEEVESVDPRMSSYYQGKLNGVNFDAIVAALVKKIQDHELRIEALERAR